MSKKKILLCVTSGIAIYKVVDLVSKLIKKNFELEIIMSENATKLVSPLVFETIGRCKVRTDMFHKGNHLEVEHIEMAKRADLCLVAPATANTIAKIANGIADNLLTSTILAYTKDVMFAVSMNTNMLNNEATIENISKLKDRNRYIFLNSKVGELACNTVGDGRLAEPSEILESIEDYFTIKDLKGKKIIVTAGPTVEPIDPVRFISNKSSGKMGFSIAEMANRRGANVILISGPTSLDISSNIKRINIDTNSQLKDEIEKEFNAADCLIMAAAPSDFKVKNPNTNKIKRKESNLKLELEPNEDIISFFGNIKKNQIIIGFAAETNNLLENAKDKMIRKNLDYIIANDITKEGAGFNIDTNIVSILSKDKIEELPIMLKIDVANKILDLI